MSRPLPCPPLSRLDEWPRHQSALPFSAIASDSVHWSDGFYFTLGSRDGVVALFLSLRLYANTDVMDAFVCVSVRDVDGVARQRNVRWSRRLRGTDEGATIDDLVCGPFSVEILRGLAVLATRCDDERVKVDLTWVGLHEPYLEDPVVRWGAGRKLVERQNFDQVCTVSGTIEVEGRAFTVDDENWVGVRDHSWGIGSTGGPPAAVVAPLLAHERPRAFALRQWVWMQTADRLVFWQCHRDAEGVLTMFEGAVLPRHGGTWRPLKSVTHERLDRSGMRMTTGEVTVHDSDGPPVRLGIELVSPPVYLQGGGYWQGWNDGRGRGVFRGESIGEADVGADAWDVSSDPSRIGDPRGVVRERPDGWAEAFGRCWRLDDPTDVAWAGFGHLETVFAP
jgi:hypothetical protein